MNNSLLDQRLSPSNRLERLFEQPSNQTSHRNSWLEDEFNNKDIVISAKRFGTAISDSRNLCRQVRNPVTGYQNVGAVIILDESGNTVGKAVVVSRTNTYVVSPWIAHFQPLSTPEEQSVRDTLVDRAAKLDSQDQTDLALDLIYDQTDKYFREGKFESVNQLLADVNAANYSVDILLGILTATLPAKEHLANRSAFFSAVEKAFTERGDMEDGLLSGLE